MQIMFWMMFIAMTMIAIVYWAKYEQECKHSYELEDRLGEVRAENLKRRTLLMKVNELVTTYSKDVINTNAHAILRELSEMNLDIKIELDTDQSN